MQSALGMPFSCVMGFGFNPETSLKANENVHWCRLIPYLCDLSVCPGADVQAGVKAQRAESPAPPMPGRRKSFGKGGLVVGQLGRMQPNGY